MQIVSIGDSLHEMLNTVFWENKQKIFRRLSAENFIKSANSKLYVSVLHRFFCIPAHMFDPGHEKTSLMCTAVAWVALCIHTLWPGSLLLAH